MVDDNLRKQMVFEENRKSVGVGYLLWLFFGWLGVHRFYAGRTKSGLVQLLLSLSVIGLGAAILWWLIDVFLVPGMINDQNMKTINMLNHGDPKGAPERPIEQRAEPQRIMSETDRKREAMLDDLRQTGYRKERRNRNPLYR